MKYNKKFFTKNVLKFYLRIVNLYLQILSKQS